MLGKVRIKIKFVSELGWMSQSKEKLKLGKSVEIISSRTWKKGAGFISRRVELSRAGIMSDRTTTGVSDTELLSCPSVGGHSPSVAKRL